MATQREHELSKQASVKRAADPHYQPSLEELRAVDAVLIEQVKEKLGQQVKDAKEVKHTLGGKDREIRAAAPQPEAGKFMVEETRRREIEATDRNTYGWNGVKEGSAAMRADDLVQHRQASFEVEYRAILNAEIDRIHGKGSLRATDAKIFASSAIDDPEMRAKMESAEGRKEMLSSPEIDKLIELEKINHKEQELQQEQAEQERDHNNTHGMEK